MSRIGWIGIGKMGNPMATRLLEAGYEMYVCDVVKENTNEIVNKGAAFIPSPMELAETVDIIFSIIPNSAVLRSIVFGDDGLLKTIKNGAIFIDMSTVDAGVSAEVNEALEGKGAKFIRANVSGSVAYAVDGTLTGLNSGDKEAYEKVLPLLKILTNKQFYLGAGDEARNVKLIINMMLGVSVAAMGEALVMGEALGIDWSVMVDALCDSAAASKAVTFKREQYRNRDFAPMHTGAAQHKDMGLALDIAKQSHLTLPLSSMAQQFYCGMGSTGRNGLDYSAILLQLEDLNGIKL